MHVAGTFHRGPGAGGYRAGGAAGGSDQALHPLKKVSYIVVISVIYEQILVDLMINSYFRSRATVTRFAAAGR